MRIVFGIVLVFAVALSGASFASAQAGKVVKKGQQMKVVKMEKKVVKKVVTKKVTPIKKVMVVTPKKKEVMQGSLSSQPKAVQEEYMRRLRESQKETKTDTTGDPMPQAKSSVTPQATSEVPIIYTDAGFSPSSISIKVGTKVKFINQSSGGMWVASAMHPTHQIYPEFDQLSTGNEYTFEFTKVGSWGYHDHVNPSHFGKVIVE